jgi:hypothetical protein
VHDLQRLVAETSDRIGMHSTVSTLMLDLDARLGGLAAEVLRASQQGRRPFRPPPGWDVLLGELAFSLINMADQTGVDIDRAVRVAADRLYRAGMQSGPAQQSRAGGDGWPLST